MSVYSDDMFVPLYNMSGVAITRNHTHKQTETHIHTHTQTHRQIVTYMYRELEREAQNPICNEAET